MSVRSFFSVLSLICSFGFAIRGELDFVEGDDEDFRGVDFERFFGLSRTVSGFLKEREREH